MSNQSATQKYNAEMDRKERLRSKKEKTKEMRNARKFELTPGNEVEGTIFGTKKREHPEYGVYYMLYIREGLDDATEGDLVSIPTFHSVLQNALAQVSASYGDPIAITYHGEVEKDDGESYHDYSVVDATEEEEEGPAFL